MMVFYVLFWPFSRFRQYFFHCKYFIWQYFVAVDVFPAAAHALVAMVTREALLSDLIRSFHAAVHY